MPEKHSRRLLNIVSIFMIVLGIPMAVWCLGLVNQATASYNYAGLGCFACAVLYALLPFAGIAGLILSKKGRTAPCRVIAVIFLAACVILAFLMAAFTVLTVPIMVVLMILYHKGSAGV